MALVLGRAMFSWLTAWTILVAFVSLNVQRATADTTRWIQYTGNDGTVWLDDDRRPSLYTQDYGGCMGDSLINVTRFDAAYYKDNMTPLIRTIQPAVYIGVYAYGESRFNLTFNPCVANINSLCPLNSSIPIDANGIIPVAPSDVANIPSIALTIPDFEGMAILRIFANSTESQIACFSAVVTNGASFSHPSAVSSILGAFAVIAFLSSIATSIYGQNIPEMRTHYAHSISMLVVFAVYHHIFFTGGLSMNWPSVLVAFWSNYAWSAGIIYNRHMQNTINHFIGSNRGNISMIGAAPNGENAAGLGGGYQITQIYKRATSATLGPYGDVLKRQAAGSANTTGGTAQSSWYGRPVLPGLPLPGNYSGFAGTLAELNIPASNAFLTGLLWYLIFVACLLGSLILLKWGIEALAACHIVKTTRLGYFRKHWLWCAGAAVLRTCYIAFFMMMFLTMFQFTLGGAHGVKAIAAVILVLFLVSMLGVSTLAIWYRTKAEALPEILEHASEGSEGSEKTGNSAWYKIGFKRAPENSAAEGGAHPKTTWWRKHLPNLSSGRVHPHDDENYTIKFGWLASRYRKSKWWFFSVWLIYELVRAAFYGGAAGHALVQVFGLLAWEIIAFVAVLFMRPFESNRLNLIMVYFLGFSKVATVALASAFDARFGLDRIITTVIGVVIIVIQGILTICLFIAIVLGAISSYMSITRYSETIKPRSWLKPRTRYFSHVAHKATDRPKPPPPPPPPEPERPKEPYFAVSSVRRELKIEDEDPDNQIPEVSMSPRASSMDMEKPFSVSRTTSMRSRTSVSNLPYGARPHRSSWSTRDFQTLDLDQGSNPMHARMSTESIRDIPSRHRAASLRGQSRAGTPIGDVTDTPNGSEAPAFRRGHRRSASTPLGPKRNNSIVAEEKEHDPDNIPSEP
ncbi:putative transient receptor potential ion channel protein [Cladophialophora carrionii]|uniref:Putative transient receptor potential ion channel protein n=1 Tax=Cladophialophora carrionii TaxID=86049 RepID=A0A1C1D2I9_9EURO|nr:putative transient receptor potential ion channel protein [Cladophialophora carrionii]